MGIFSSIRHSIHSAVDPLGGIERLVGGGKKGGGSNPAAAPEPDPSQTDPMYGYYGDQGDPQYGSLLDPFDAQHFYEYQDPGYWFRVQQGQQALRNAASAGSGALSGSALKDLLQYNQDMASTEYGNAFNRYQTQQGNIFSRLSDIARLGQSAAAGVGSAGTQLAGNAGQALQNAGSAQGAGIVGTGNAIGQGLTNYWLYGTKSGQALINGTGGV